MRKPEKAPVRFAVCIKNKGYEASLELGKFYRVLRDAEAEGRGYLRVVDESGEDYGYAASRFFAIDIPKPPQSRIVAVLPNSAVNAPHSAVTALAQGRKRRAVGRAGWRCVRQRRPTSALFPRRIAS